MNYEPSLLKVLELRGQIKGVHPLFHRITFYEAGAGVIAALGQGTPGYYADLENLFWRMHGLKLG